MGGGKQGRYPQVLGNDGEGWRQILSGSSKKGRDGSYLSILSTFWEYRAQIEFNVANVQKWNPVDFRFYIKSKKIAEENLEEH